MKTGVLLFACVLAGTAAARAHAVTPSADGEVLAGAGLDTNPFLQVAVTPESPIYRDARNVGFFRAAPALRGLLAGGAFRLELRYDGDLRALSTNGYVLFHQGSLGLTLPEVGRFSLGATALLSRYDDAWDSTPAVRFNGGGVRLDASARLLPTLKLGVWYRFDQRKFVDVPTVDHDLTHSAETRLRWRPRPDMEIGLFLDGMVMNTSGLVAKPAVKTELGRVHRLQAGIEAWCELGPRLQLSGSAWAGQQWLTDLTVAGKKSPLEHSQQVGGSVSIDLLVTSWLDATLRYNAYVNRATDALAPNWGRHVVMAGLIGHIRVPRSITGPSAPSGGEAPQVAPGGATFMLSAPSARSVVVVGSWNGWLTDAPQQALRRTEAGGSWRGWVPTGSGQHRYRFLVDGKAVRPPDAPRYAADDFGGEDGILDVP